MLISNDANKLELLIRVKSFGGLLIKHVKTHAITWLFLIALYHIFTLNYLVGINQTPSLPFKFFLIRLNENVETGGYIAFKWHGGKPYRDGAIFVKRLLAGPGDSVVRHHRNFSVGNRTLIGKAEGLTAKKLSPNDELREGGNTLQLGKYFVAGDHEYSLDSRYNALGLVDRKDVVGRAFPIF